MYGLASAQSTALNTETDQAMSILLRETIRKIDEAVEKEIIAFEKEALSRVSKKQQHVIEKAFQETRKELSAVFQEELTESGKRVLFRIRNIEPDMRTIENEISVIYKEEIAAGCTRAKCSAEEIKKIVQAYIIKKYIVVPKLQEYSIFVQNAMKLITVNDAEITHMIDDTKKEIGKTFFGIGDNLRRKVVQLLTQASGQLQNGILSLHEVNEELITIEKGIKENSISVNDITAALARIKEKMQVFQEHRGVDGKIDHGIGKNILQILNDKALQRGITHKNEELAKQGEPKIILQDYIISVQTLIDQTQDYINRIDGYAKSNEIRQLYEVLPMRVVIDKPLVFPPRKPPAPLTIPPSGVSADHSAEERARQKKLDRQEARKRAKENSITLVYLGNAETIEKSSTDPDSRLNILKNADGINVVIVRIDKINKQGGLDGLAIQEYCNGVLCPFNTIEFSALPPGLDYTNLMPRNPNDAQPIISLIIVFKNGKYVPLDFKTREDLKKWIAQQKIRKPRSGNLPSAEGGYNFNELRPPPQQSDAFPPAERSAEPPLRLSPSQ